MNFHKALSIAGILGSIVLGISSGLLVSEAQSNGAPAGQLSSFINTSATNQTKTGSFAINVESGGATRPTIDVNNRPTLFGAGFTSASTRATSLLQIGGNGQNGSGTTAGTFTVNGSTTTTGTVGVTNLINSASAPRAVCANQTGQLIFC